MVPSLRFATPACTVYLQPLLAHGVRAIVGVLPRRDLSSDLGGKSGTAAFTRWVVSFFFAALTAISLSMFCSSVCILWLTPFVRSAGSATGGATGVRCLAAGQWLELGLWGSLRSGKLLSLL